MSVSPQAVGDDLVALFHSGSIVAHLVCGSLYVLTPLSWLYVGWTFYYWNTTSRAGRIGRALHWATFAYASTECAFALYYRWLAYRVQRRRPLPQRDPAFLRNVLVRSLESGMGESLRSIGKQHDVAGQHDEEPSFMRDLLAEDDPRAVDFRHQMRAWFLMARFEDVRQDNVASWLAWSFFDQQPEEVQSEEAKEFLRYALQLIQARSGKAIPPGFNPNVTALRLTLDYVRITQRPLFLYLLVNAANSLTVRRAQRNGFLARRYKNVEYLVRPAHCSVAGWHRPLVFIHGLGIGLAQYAALLDYLVTDERLRDRTIIVLRQPHISMHLWHRNFLRPPQAEAFVGTFQEMLREYSLDSDGIDVLGHSNGTTLAGWLVKTAPDLVRRCCLVDPVCFWSKHTRSLYEPDVPYAFLHRKPFHGIEVLMRYFVARELGTANALQRHFDWTSNLMWAEDLDYLTDPKRMNVYLAENDRILSARRVGRYLLGHGMKLRQDGGGLNLIPNAQHGECLTASGPGLSDIVDWLADGTHTQGNGSADVKDKFV